MSTPTSTDSWNPDQYRKYKNERSQPFFDLAAMITKEERTRTVLDLGCGSGELTATLPEMLNAENVLGIDSSESMLKKALPLQNEKLKFQLGQIESFANLGKFDVIISNAAIQWAENHAQIFTQIKESLNPSGQLAVQMPMNHDYPTHILAHQMSLEPQWSKLLNGENYGQSQRILPPEKYAELLFNLGFLEQKVLQRVYGHVMESREDVIEWVKGSMLTFFQSRLTSADFTEFQKEYKERLFQVLPDQRPFFYPFKRIFIWAKV